MHKGDWRLILLVVYIFVIVSLNEIGLGVVSLVLLFPAVWLVIWASDVK